MDRQKTETLKQSDNDDNVANVAAFEITKQHRASNGWNWANYCLTRIV